MIVLQNHTTLKGCLAARWGGQRHGQRSPPLPPSARESPRCTAPQDRTESASRSAGAPYGWVGRGMLDLLQWCACLSTLQRARAPPARQQIKCKLYLPTRYVRLAALLAPRCAHDARTSAPPADLFLASLCDCTSLRI